MSNTTVNDTPRLQFEPLRAEHAAELFEPLCDALVYEYIDEPAPENVAALAERFARMAAGPSDDCRHERWINFAVRLRETSALIGRVEATLVEARAEVAYLFDPDRWGQGYATEAMTAFQDYLRQNHRITEFWATTAPRNARSIALLQRLGYREALEGRPPLDSYETGDLVFALRSSAYLPATPARKIADPDQ